MILGIGTDLANIDRIQRSLDQYGDRFRNRVFSKIEQQQAKAYKNEISTYAKRWAAKEACSKALGTGISKGVCWHDISVSNLESGRPIVTLTGGAKDRLDFITPKGHTPKIHISLSDDHPWAQAFVIIESHYPN
tara:strand:- start:88 stop:489 length:402 start_codon:yes stop_codon:yes gene_type:complete